MLDEFRLVKMIRYLNRFIFLQCENLLPFIVLFRLNLITAYSCISLEIFRWALLMWTGFLSAIHVFPLYIFDVFMLIAYLISIQIDINHTKTTNNIYISLTTTKPWLPWVTFKVSFENIVTRIFTYFIDRVAWQNK